MQEVDVCITFCEGAHDVAFLHRTLKSLFGFVEETNWAFKDYPAPLNVQFQATVAKHFSQDLSHTKLYDFLLPKKVLRRADIVVLIFRTDGGDRAKLDRARVYLERFFKLLRKAQTFPDNPTVRNPTACVSRAFVLFLYDAEGVGFKKVRETLYSVFGALLADSLGDGGWVVDAHNPALARAERSAVYIWGDDEGFGTLEDLLLPIHEESDPERFNAAKDCIDALCSWDIAKIPQRAKRGKSIMCLLGQKKKPGSAHSVMIDHTKTMREQAFASSPAVVSFSAFLQDFLGVEQAV